MPNKHNMISYNINKNTSVEWILVQVKQLDKNILMKITNIFAAVSYRRKFLWLHNINHVIQYYDLAHQQNIIGIYHS